MSKIINQTPKNRLAAELETWNRVEQGLLNRHGRRIAYDRQFLRAKRDHLKEIEQKFSKGNLNSFEKAEQRIIRSQHRSLNRRMYPNPFIRLARNIAVLAFSIVKQAFKIGGTVLKASFDFNGEQKVVPEKKAILKQNADTVVIKRPNSQKQNNNTKGNQKAPTQIPIVRKLPVKPRTQIPARSRGVRV